MPTHEPANALERGAGRLVMTPTGSIDTRARSRRIFVSFTNDDLAMARIVADHLERAGWQVWMSDRSIAPGSQWSEEVVRGLRETEAVVVLITHNSVHSPWVEREVEAAASSRIPILPVVFGGVAPSPGLRLYVNTVQQVELQSVDAAAMATVEDALLRILRRSGQRRSAPVQLALGRLMVAVGLLGCVIAFGLFFYFGYQAIAADSLTSGPSDFPRSFEDSRAEFERSVQADNDRFLRVATAFPVFFVSMLIYGAGESLRRAALRKRI